MSIDEREPQPGDLNPPASEPEAAPPAVEAIPLEERFKNVLATNMRLVEENKNLKDQLLRRQADFSNYRKRVEREQQEFRQAAQGELLEGLLPVLDGFERALAHGGESVDQEYRKGIELIYKQLFDALARMGLEPVAAVGQTFDPFLHHAVERVETTEHPDQMILAELQRGYTFRQRLLRPALVRVATHPATPESPPDA